MFIMTADITIGSFKPFKPHSVSWKRSVDSYSDSALIKIPAIAMLKTTGDTYKQVESGLQFTEGMKVQIDCGYNGKNITRFKGFIRRINFSTPIEIDCEGYSYQLRLKTNFNKSYPSGTKMRTVLTDLVQGTDIKLSPLIPDVTVTSPMPFPNSSGIQVLEWFKERMAQTIYFNYDELYVGLKEIPSRGTAKYKLGWNVVKDNDLKFNDKKEHANVRIQLQSRNKDGSYTKEIYDSKFTDVKVVRVYVKFDDAYMKLMAQDLKSKWVNKGYEGMITTFGVPYVEPGYTAGIQDPRYVQRTGNYFVETVDGDFSPNGFRQKVKIGNSL